MRFIAEVGYVLRHSASIIRVELAKRSGNVMNCHAMPWGSIPSRNGVFIELHVLHKGSKWGCRL